MNNNQTTTRLLAECLEVLENVHDSTVDASSYPDGENLSWQVRQRIKAILERAGEGWQRADEAEAKLEKLREAVPCLRVDGWSYIGGVNTLEGPTEVMAAKSEDGIGIMARWTLQPDGTWDVKVWDTEMPHGMVGHRLG